MATALQPVNPASLYDLEQDLVALLDTEECVPEELRKEFEQALAESLKNTVQKRDRVGQFIRHCELQQDACESEIKRLEARKQMFASVEKQMRNYVLSVIYALGKDAKDKYRKLEGQTVTFSAAKNPKGVDVVDESLIPARHKSITITLPMDAWTALQPLFDDVVLDSSLNAEDVRFVRLAIQEAKETATVTVSKSSIKQQLEAGQEVPGARLKDDVYRLKIS